MKVKLTRPWKNYLAGSVLDVSDGVHDDLVRAGVLEIRRKPERTPDKGPKPSTSSFRRPPRDKMIESPVEDK